MIKKIDWTEDKLKFIKEHYKKDYTGRQLADYFGCSVSIIYHTVFDYGLSNGAWTIEGDKRLTMLAEKYNPKEISKIMCRTYSSITQRLSKLEIHTLRGREWFNLADAAYIFGTDKGWVLRQKNLGKLKGKRYHPESGSKGWWRFERKDLAIFIRKYPDELQDKKVIMFCIVDILAGILPVNGD